MANDVAVSLALSIADARQRCKSDKFYLAEQLGFDFVWETHAELFANYIKYDSSKPWGEQSTNKDVMVLWSRGHYKTTSLIVEIIQAILNYPNIRILIMQGSLKVTQTFLKQIVAHFTGEAEGSRLMELFPEFCGVKDEDGSWKFGKKVLNATAAQFTTTARTRKQLAQATVTVASPKSVKTGQHYDIGFFDDLVNDQNFRKAELLEKVRQEFTLAQALIDPGGYRFVTGTRYAFGDLYEQILRWQNESNNWIISVKDCWTDASANLPDEQKVPRFPRYTMRSGQIGGFTTDQLLQMQKNDPGNFSCQYLNRPIHTSQQAFTEELLYKACVPEQDTPPLSDCILMVDVASTTEDYSDDSVIQVGRTDSQGTIYICGQRGGQWQPDDLAMQVIEMAVHYRPNRVLVEKSGAGTFFASLLKVIARQKSVFLPVDFIPVDNRNDAKNLRVLSLAGAVKRGRVKFLAGLPRFDKLVKQAIQFPKGQHGHDDYIDTAALMFMELSKTNAILPIRRVHNPILAMIQATEDPLVKVLTEAEQRHADQQQDITGWE